MQKVPWGAKFFLGITNLFIGLGFFAWYGTQPIQKYFALPLFLSVGTLFLFESCHRKNDRLKKPDLIQTILLLLYLFYPGVSMLLGNSFPRIVTSIMPCPAISLSIAVYAGYNKKNKLLLVLLTVWGLTGIKSIIFQAYEYLILFICGFYGIHLLLSERKQYKEKR